MELLFNLGRRISSALSACDPQKFPFRLASANKRDRKADRLETKTKRNARESLKVISPDDFIDVFMISLEDPFLSNQSNHDDPKSPRQSRRMHAAW